MKVHDPTRWNRHAVVCERSKALFIEVRGTDAVPEREAEIAALPQKDWRGQRLYALMCEGPFGNGPHVQFVPEYVLWNQISLDHFLCPFHR